MFFSLFFFKATIEWEVNPRGNYRFTLLSQFCANCFANSLLCPHPFALSAFMRFPMLSALRAQNECELTFPTLTRRTRHSAIDSVNKSRPANSFSNRTTKEISILAAIHDI